MWSWTSKKPDMWFPPPPYLCWGLHINSDKKKNLAWGASELRHLHCAALTRSAWVRLNTRSCLFFSAEIVGGATPCQNTVTQTWSRVQRVNATSLTCQKKNRWWAAAPTSPGPGWRRSPWRRAAGRRRGRGRATGWRSASAPPRPCPPARPRRAPARCRGAGGPSPAPPYLQAQESGRVKGHLVSPTSFFA